MIYVYIIDVMFFAHKSLKRDNKKENNERKK